MGADKIKLLGMDCNYTEFIPESKKLDDGTLVITKTPKNNPNYFFNYYQMQGDIYNKPNGTRIHKASWMDLAHIVILYNQLSRKQVDVINYNTNDTLDKYYQREKDIIKILDSK